ncbi:MAG: hypothetical protein SNJ59_11185 [Aggregatilineales bacterium]
MNRHDVRLLQTFSGYPSISILAPTHRTSPDNKQDPIRVKNLVTEATNRLLKEFSKREVDGILSRLDGIVERVDWQNTLDGLAIFVNADFAHAYTFPFKVKERVVIDETFATRDLVFAVNRTNRYWTLVLSEQPTRLFEGVKDSLVEVTVGSRFPMTHDRPGGATRLPGGPGVNPSTYARDMHRQFFRDVDAALKEIMDDDPLPIVLVGVTRQLSLFEEVTSHGGHIIAKVEGSHDKTSAHELGQLVWPLAKDKIAEQRNKVLDELGAAVGARRFASTIGEVWRMAREGRGDTLIVEEGYFCPVRVDESGMHITIAEDATAPDVIDDAVDEVIEAVLAKDGRVVFVEPGALANHQQIALILRY